MAVVKWNEGAGVLHTSSDLPVAQASLKIYRGLNLKRKNTREYRSTPEFKVKRARRHFLHKTNNKVESYSPSSVAGTSRTRLEGEDLKQACQRIEDNLHKVGLPHAHVRKKRIDTRKNVVSLEKSFIET
jgi:hypothetical protein